MWISPNKLRRKQSLPAYLPFLRERWEMGATEFLVSKHRALDLQNDDDGREIKGTVHSSCEQIFFLNFFISTITFIAVRYVFFLFAMHSPFMEAVKRRKTFF